MKTGNQFLGATMVCAPLAFLTLMLWLSIGSRAEPAGEKATAANEAAKSPAAQQLANDPDKAWKEIDNASKPPPLPPEWGDKAPTEEQKTVFYKLLGERSADVAAKAREFYTRFPNHPKAAEAKEKEKRFLQQAQAYGNNSVNPRTEGTLGKEEILQQKLNAVNRKAMERRAEGMPAVLKEFEIGMRALTTEYPDRPEPWDALLIVAQRGDKEHAKQVLADIIAAKSADEETKARAKGMLKVIGALGRPLEISFTALDGKKVDLQKMKGTVVLVDFWASWCGPCMAGLPEVIDIYQKYHDKGFEIVGINLDKDKHALEKTIQERNMTWPQYFDGLGWGNKIAMEYSISAIPSMWLVDKTGVLRNLEAREDLEKKVKDLLAEKI
ncbi:MAG TPA: TlpA disulfide reductase family protein [Verrucomicrobiae bacterium]|jgi:thiol-disulfide isomerase/thioredoxin|nr:TlpA disulfide reductase family protein [Verrucomicrobiae bacterium]